MVASEAFTKLRTAASERRTARERQRLIEKIGELEYIQRTDSEASYDNDIATLVEKVRHIDRMAELERRQDSSS